MRHVPDTDGVSTVNSIIMRLLVRRVRGECAVARADLDPEGDQQLRVVVARVVGNLVATTGDKRRDRD
eukprot:1127770-Prymnesium_polylepis.1